jgi:hypothetical protein
VGSVANCGNSNGASQVGGDQSIFGVAECVWRRDGRPKMEFEQRAGSDSKENAVENGISFD